MIMNTWNQEEVNGSVVGTYYLVGQLVCNGRNQGQKLCAESEQALKVKANEYVAEKKVECGEVFNIIFPGKWELKILS